ncbi:MAG: transglycosylase SLT domain-containing protein [Candidatus Eremiobacteraeota bacterium]|nr:transglycosylase SLT domain-containing protein [Candidatus Eremiobacteraeota bacterium]MCW5869334.1 transglycosylase SLT domain-containing protein [Candidatus Eremiobacteraeota bacterium]
MAIKPDGGVTNNASQIKAKPVVEKAKPVEIKKPEPKAEVAQKAPVELSEEAKGNKGKKDGDAKHLGALMDNFKDDPKKGDAKDPKDPKAEDKKDPKAPADKKEIQQKLDKLQQELKDAQKRGDKDAIARLTGEIAGLQKQLQGDNPPGTNNGGDNGTPAVNGGNNGGNNGGAAPAGGNNGGGAAPAGGNNGGGAAPAGGDNGGGAAPAGGNPGAGGANEAGAGQGAGAGKEEVDQFIQFAAQAYGADPKVLSEIARRESNFNTGDIANNWDSNAKKGTPSKGMFQFIEPTFKSMMPQAKAANPQAWQGVSENWTDWKAQALTTAWAITHGKGSHWSTYQAAVNTARGGGGTQTA